MSGLDPASHEFLQFALEQSKDQNETDASGRRWVQFDAIAKPGLHSREVAARAFLHVLTLATKGAMPVRQDGAEQAIPFGTISIGLPDSSAD